MNARTKIGVLGLGNAGMSLHLPALQSHDETVVVGCDIDPKRRAEAASRFGISTFDSLGAMLADAQPDVVIVGTPPSSHTEICLLLMESGVDVICEKPLANSVDEALQIAEAVRRTGCNFALNHEFREMPIFRGLRDHVGVEGIGRLVNAHVWQSMDLPPWKEKGWRSEMPTGVFFEGGIHLIDFALALFGEKPLAVTAFMSSCGTRDFASDAYASATLEFSHGRLAQVVQNRLSRGDTQFFEARVDCTEASLRASYGGRARLTAGLLRDKRPHLRFEYGLSGIAWCERGHARDKICGNPKDPPMIATRLLLEKTLEAFRNGGQPPASIDDAVDGLEVLAACYHSASAGERVTLEAEVREDLKHLVMGAPE